MEPDFSGYATKAGLRCSDGRTITAEAFKHMDGMQVPLVWKHDHDSPENVLGHGILRARPDGMWVEGFFNNTPSGQNARALVQHGDIKSLSIYANQLVEKVIGKSKQVLHGMIREVSLVIAGANPGAFIENVRIAHSADPSDIETLEDEAIIHMGLDIEFTPDEEDDEDDFEHADGRTVEEVYNSMTEEQKAVCHFMVGAALESGSLEQSDNEEGVTGEDTDDNDGETVEGDLEHQEGKGPMTKNVFDQNKKTPTENRPVLSHEDVKGIVASAVKGGSLKHAMEEYALAHGINDIEVLFPDARSLQDRPEFNQRRMEWVSGVINGTGKTPFAKVKTITADITQDEARAKGYIKGEYKKEEWFGVTKRTTGPTTVYKKQKLDRDDIIDITDFDVVAWLWMEIEMMLKEELARAILIGDGRDISDEDKIKDPAAATDGNGIRSILNEHELFATTINVNLGDANSTYLEVIDALVRSRKFYKGSGAPTFYTTETHLAELLLLRDEANSNRRLYNSVEDLARALRVREIVTVEPMEDAAYADLIGIIVNLADYNIGTNKGGELTRFDDFDIDYNQYKYLLETRLSGALTKIKSALILKKTASANVLVHPITEPTFVPATGVVTIPTQTGVVYKNKDTNATLTAGAQAALAAGATLNVIATPASGYYFASNAEDEWSFTRPAA